MEEKLHQNATESSHLFFGLLGHSISTGYCLVFGPFYTEAQLPDIVRHALSMLACHPQPVNEYALYVVV
jgi:hypothetical protein